MRTTAAIASTLRNVEGVVDSFISYHLAIGFDHLFLFFDNPSEPAVRQAEKFPKVTVIPHDEALRERWKSVPVAQSERCSAFVHAGNRNREAHRHDDVMVRQILNVAVAIELGRERKIEWLLHIDGDELFYTATPPVEDHFAALDELGIEAVRYPNFEALPESSSHQDYFREVSLFKKNSSAKKLTRSLLCAIPQLPPKLFHFYRNGKSAARLNLGLQPDGVHCFTGAEGFQTHVRVREDPVILHYPCCGFRHFWEKYRALGAFNDFWWDRVNIAEAIGSFHGDARDIVGRGDVEAARAFYESRFVVVEPSKVAELVARDICVRIVGPARMLKQSDQLMNAASRLEGTVEGEGTSTTILSPADAGVSGG